MARRTKAENERRIIVPFSISNETNQQLNRLRERLAYYMGTEPSVEDIRSFVRGKIHATIEEYLNEPLEPELAFGSREEERTNNDQSYNDR